MRHTSLILVFACVFATTAPGQTPSAPDPDGRRLTPGTHSLVVYMIQGRDTVKTGTVHDELRVVRDGNRDVLQRIYQSVDLLRGTRTDTLTDELQNLRPVRHRSHSEGGLEIVDFSSDRARGWMRLANGDSVTIDVALGGAFNASSFDMVLRASSLKPGWQATVLALVSSARTTMPLTARVIGNEMIGSETCWRVQAEFGGTPVTFWISQQSRQLRQQLMVLRPDMQILFRTP